MHTYIHVLCRSKHTYKQIHAYIQFIFSCSQYRQAYIHTYIHTYIYHIHHHINTSHTSYIHTSHTYITYITHIYHIHTSHTYIYHIHTLHYIHTYIHSHLRIAGAASDGGQYKFFRSISREPHVHCRVNHRLHRQKHIRRTRPCHTYIHIYIYTCANKSQSLCIGKYAPHICM